MSKVDLDEIKYRALDMMENRIKLGLDKVDEKSIEVHALYFSQKCLAHSLLKSRGVTGKEAFHIGNDLLKVARDALRELLNGRN